MLSVVSSASRISPMCRVGTDSCLIMGWGGSVPAEILSCLILSFVFWFQCLSKDIAVLLGVPDWVFVIYLSPTCLRVCVPLHLNSSCSSV